MFRLGEKNSRSLLTVLAIVAIASAGAGAGISALRAQGGPEQTATPLDATPPPVGTPAPPAPSYTPGPPAPTMTPEEEREFKEELRRRAIEEGAHRPASGPATYGKTIVIADKTLQLPQDAYIEGNTVIVECRVESKCPASPVYVLARGGSSIRIDRNGNIYGEILAPGEEHAFDFVRAVFGK